MTDQERVPQDTADAAVDAVLTASRLLVAVSARSFAAVEDEDHDGSDDHGSDDGPEDQGESATAGR